MNKNSRPLSPHLSIYKPQISSVLSIGHRATGVGLFIAILMLTGWFICWSFDGGNDAYFLFFNNWMVKAMLYIASYGYFYHFCTGIRHLVWDAGYGFSISSVNITGWISIAASLLLTAVFWLLIYGVL